MSLKEQFGQDILLTGWGHSPFGKLADETLESLIVGVARDAIANAGLEPGQIDEVYLGQFNSGMVPLGFASSLALQVSISAFSSKRFFLRVSRSAKRGSAASSGRPINPHRTTNCSCLLAAMLIRPSAVAKAPEGAAVMFSVPIGRGSTPAVR